MLFELSPEQVDSLVEALDDDPAWDDVVVSLLKPIPIPPPLIETVYLPQHVRDLFVITAGGKVDDHRSVVIERYGVDGWWHIPVGFKDLTYGAADFWKKQHGYGSSRTFGYMNAASCRFVTDPEKM